VQCDPADYSRTVTKRRYPYDPELLASHAKTTPPRFFWRVKMSVLQGEYVRRGVKIKQLEAERDKLRAELEKVKAQCNEMEKKWGIMNKPDGAAR
jgi:hypothetical protein